MAKLSVKAFGVSLGIVMAGLTLLLGVMNILFYWGSGLNRVMAIVCLGYKPTILGVILSSLWGFLYAFILGSLIAWLYNRIVDEDQIEIENKIKQLAKTIWESKGKPEGSALADWKEAEKRVKGS